MREKDEACRRCGGLLPRSVQRGVRWVERAGDVCEDCQSGGTLTWCNDQITRTQAILDLMVASNAVLTNPGFFSEDGQSHMYNGLLALGYSEAMARWAVIDGGGKPRFDDLEIESARADLVRLTALRERFLSTAED